MYSPILVWFVPPIIGAEDQLLGDPRYFVEITAPPSNRRGLHQHLPETVIKPIMPTEPLRLKLMRSDCFRPIGRYQVRYFLKNKSDPIHKEQWIVREPKPVYKDQIVSTGGRDILPPAIYDVQQTSWNGTYKLHYLYDRVELEWLTNPPPTGTTYEITAVPALTLDQLIDHVAL